MDKIIQARRTLIQAIISDYHTTRLDSDYASHILSKARTQDAFARFERDILATRTDATPVAEAWAGMEAAMQDPDYAWGWHCNLAMPIMDATGITHEQANMAAAHLMQHLWKCDITTHPHYGYKKSDAQSYAEFRIEADKAEDAALPDATHPPATDVAALVEAAKAFAEIDLTRSGLPDDFAMNVLAIRLALAPFTKALS